MKILRKDDELVAIRKGKYVDLVFSAKNPLDDIQAIQHVVMVVKNGRVYHP